MKRTAGFRDWALAIVSILFTLGGLLVLRDDRDQGIIIVALFGLCTVVAVLGLLRKRREARLATIAGIQVTGGVPIRPSRLRMTALGAGVFGLGAVILVFGHDIPLLVHGCGWVMVVPGAFLLGAVATGHLPNEFLVFQEEGLVVGSKGWKAMVPWDRLLAAQGGEFNSNPVLYLYVDQAEGCPVLPAAKHPAFLKHVRQCRAWMGADLFLLLTHFDVDLPVLLAAIERYRMAPAARTELAVRVLAL